MFGLLLDFVDRRSRSGLLPCGHIFLMHKDRTIERKSLPKVDDGASITGTLNTIMLVKPVILFFAPLFMGANDSST